MAKSPSEMVTISVPKEITEIYFAAKAAILFLEVKEEFTSNEAAIEIRDCLDHLMLAFANSSDPEKMEAQSNGAIEHLRRASIEPYELAVENKLAKIIKRQTWRWWHIFLFIPNTKNDAQTKLLRSIKRKIFEGRQCKNLARWKEGIKLFQDAYEECLTLEKIVPHQGTIFSRLFSIILAAISFLAGWLI